MRIFFLLVDSDSHRDDILELFSNETTALRYAQAAVNVHTSSGRKFTDKLTDEMRLEGWRFFVCIGEERSVSVHRLRLVQ